MRPAAPIGKREETTNSRPLRLLSPLLSAADPETVAARTLLRDAVGATFPPSVGAVASGVGENRPVIGRRGGHRRGGKADEEADCRDAEELELDHDCGCSTARGC